MAVAKTKTLYMQEFLDGGILREKSFREKLAAINWAEEFRDAKVVITGCDTVPIPIWAYMAVAAHIAPYAKRIFWGEPCSAVPVYIRPAEQTVAEEEPAEK